MTNNRQEAGQGSAIVDFVLVGGLLVLLFMSVVQFALGVHIRNTLIDCAAEGARYAALADLGPDDGVARTRQLITSALAPRFADDVVATTTFVGGRQVVEVTVSAPLPVIGLFGSLTHVTVSGHAFDEAP